MDLEEMEVLYELLSRFKSYGQTMWGYGEPIQQALTITRAAVGELLYRATAH